MKLRNIIALDETSNKKGDLFCRLMSDLFHALGYDQPRFDVHKSGREIDLIAIHRIEKKIAVAECKAHKKTIGGSDINKFIGSLDAEKRKYLKTEKFMKFSVVGYFISLSGFKETSIEQELDLDNDRLILIKPANIIEELVHGKIIVSIEQAVSVLDIPSGKVDLHADLVAYRKGWVWAIYLTNGQITTHVCFVHAEGNLLIKELAYEIIALDNKTDKRFENLEIICASDILPKIQIAKEKYFKYIETECGEIHFEGLPTDKDAGSVKVKLENIFITPHLELIPDKINQKDFDDVHKDQREGLGDVLSKNGKLAILAKPGGGKSTLVKRLAIAYAYPYRKDLIKDELPNSDWFPIFLRCRELGERVTKSITEIIQNIPNRAEISDCIDEFALLTSTSLQDGSALLLIDGLDEISEDKHRVSFINQLRTFTATYPNIQIVITSREAGFRVVGGIIASYCSNYKLSALNPEEIEELSVKWHREIIDDSEKTKKDAISLSKLIIGDSRIRNLAENPLLLTTLLFVKRWAGYLPTKKSVLYQEMIKLLMVTWNVEGHEQLDIEEAEPQLAYVAFWMTLNGTQTITFGDLKDCLQSARKQMPDILGFTNISVPEFIRRVESRSSLLILSGHKELETGEITPIYEFLHLSFQEHLTAKAIVEKFVSQEYANMSALEILEPHISDESWKEVVPLVAILLKRDAVDLIKFLIENSIITDEEDLRTHRAIDSEVSPAELLGNCIANEIQVAPEVLDTAIEWYVKNRYTIQDKSSLDTILNSKFEKAFREKLNSLYFSEFEDKFSTAIGGQIGEAYLHRLRKEGSKILNRIVEDIVSPDKVTSCSALFGMMIYAFELWFPSKAPDEKITTKEFDPAIKKIVKLILHADLHYVLPACWSLAWLSDNFKFSSKLKPKLIEALIKGWLGYTQKEVSVSRVHAWSLLTLLNASVDLFGLNVDIDALKETVKDRFVNPNNNRDQFLSVLLGYHVGIKFNKTKVQEIFIHEIKKNTDPPPSYLEYAKNMKVNLKEEISGKKKAF